MAARRITSPVLLYFALWLHVFGIKIVWSWWDQGHLLTSGVARLELTDQEAEILEKPLFLWDPAFDGLSTITMSSIWADHVKCRTRVSNCLGLDTVPNFRSFDAWHYTTFIYNPENIIIQGVDAYHPLPDTGNVWALKDMLYSVPNTADWVFTGAAAPSNASRVESRFAWNLRLRMLTHLLGDLHCPMHAVGLFTEATPTGDAGGNLVYLNLETATVIPPGESFSNLHALWDACGGLYTTSWPTLTETEVLAQAEELREEFPKSFFGNRLNVNNFDDLAQETFELSKEKVYVEALWNTSEFRESRTFTPTDEYLLEMQHLCRQQLTLAGYRMATVLKAVANHLEFATWDISDETPRKDSALGRFTLKSVFVLASVLVLPLIGA